MLLELAQRSRAAKIAVGLTTLVLLVATPDNVWALANQPITGLEVPDLVLDPDAPIGPEVPPLPCQPRIGAKGLPTVEGMPLLGLTVTLNAASVKLFNSDPYCDSYYQPLEEAEWTWSVTERPSASSATLVGIDTLEPTLRIDAPGTYEITLRVCPDGCPFLDTTLTVPPTDRVVRFTTREFLRPERHPVAPPSVRGSATCDLDTGTCEESSLPCQSDFDCASFNQPEFAADLVDVKCQFGGGVTDPQWVTVREFTGPERYAGYHDGVVHAVEGVVRRARISSMDNEFNHHSQDANWNVMLDGIHRHMKLGGGLSMHNEWETATLDRAFQPSRGDRVSMWGYLIHDCGHGGFKTEIHPPVGLAVHRERAVPIPPDWTSPLLPDEAGNPSSVGTGVFVPGIVTDVWFNRDAGEMIEGDRTGLHQPAVFQPSPCALGQDAACRQFRGETGYVIGGDAFDMLAPLGAVFQFRVHLPRSPQAVLETAGVDGRPEVPLYYEILGGNVPESRIDVEVITEETGTIEPDVTYLRVRVDLTEPIATTRPWFRMAAAWVYPDPDNWNLERRRVTVPKLYVTNEGDGFLRGRGEWKLWLQVNNSSPLAPVLSDGRPLQEWTRIVNGLVQDGCDFYFGIGCGEDYDFGGRPWSTGNPQTDRSLGPDPLVYPDQPVQIHLSGFEEDWLGGDSLGVIEQWHFDAVEDGRQKNACENPDIDFIAGDDLEGHLPQNAGCGRFELRYRIDDLGPVAPATLSAAAQAFREQYRLRGTDCSDDVGPCNAIPRLLDGALPPPQLPGALHPLQEVRPLDEVPDTVFDTDLYEKREAEEYVLNSLNIGDLRAKIEWDLERDPAVAEAFLAELRETFDDALARLGDEVLLDLMLVEQAVPPRLFERYFGDVPEPEPLPGTTTRHLRGAGQLGTGGDATHLNAELHCDPLRGPNKLRLQWRDDPYRLRRFELDVMLEVACDGPAEPMKTHAGRGLGTLDGVPGYLVEWTLADRGKGQHDRDVAAVRVISPQGEVVHVRRAELEGQLHAGE